MFEVVFHSRLYVCVCVCEYNLSSSTILFKRNNFIHDIYADDYIWIMSMCFSSLQSMKLIAIYISCSLTGKTEYIMKQIMIKNSTSPIIHA